MLRKLWIDRFRSFKQFEIAGLGHVNLVVGTNNCGKTTLLEAAQLLTNVGDAGPIWTILSRRGEDLWEEREIGRSGRSVEIRRLFHGYSIDPGSRFEVHAENDGTTRSLVAEIAEASQSSAIQPQLFDGEQSGSGSDHLIQPSALSLSWHGPMAANLQLPISRRGGLSVEAYRRSVRQVDADTPSTVFITAAALSPEAVMRLFEDIVLTPEENLVIEALQIIDPTIERIATSGTERWLNSPAARVGSRGGILVRCAGVKERIPIGSMGDGIWRILGLALALVKAENGFVLVDEIDTGLHATVMADMWRLVYRTAKRLNAQVFATTHSRDCYESLAAICREEVSDGSDIMIHRIERGRSSAVSFTEQEIVAAAERGIEVR